MGERTKNWLKDNPEESKLKSTGNKPETSPTKDVDGSI
jgi:hypothetical protein